MKEQRIPEPAEMAADVFVSGHTSIGRNVEIISIGDHIPATFSHTRIRNTPGFSWYVSKHYALKTDYPENTAREFLLLLELAFPHYVALFGREIEELRYRRMGCIYGQTMESLERAMLSDDMHVFGGGGITQEGFYCTYQRPSNPYHSRYILIHECVHLYQYCLAGTTTNTTGAFIEGVADRLSSHVFDAARKQLTVNVLDRAPVHNFMEYGLNYLKEHSRLSFKKCHMGSDRGVNVLEMAYLQHTPEYAQKWRIYRDEMFRLSTPGTKKEVSGKLLLELYGSWSKLNAGFRQWLRSLGQSTFHMADWGFDQAGNALVSFGAPRHRKNAYSQMDINLAPGRPPKPDWHHCDYPAEPVSSLVGPVRRGVRNPSVGCLIDLSPASGKGRAGLALGRDEFVHVALVVEDEKHLIIYGPGLGVRRTRVCIPRNMQESIRKHGWRVGLTATIGDKSLSVLLRAGSKPMREFTASIPISKRLRRRLMTKPMAILGVGGRHHITPFVDDGRLTTGIPLSPAPANRWSYAADAELYRAYKACRRLGSRAPAALRSLRDKMLRSVGQPEAPCSKLVREFRAVLPGVVKRIHGGSERNRLAVLDLAGLTLDVLLREERPGKCVATAVIKGPVWGPATGSVRFAAVASGGKAVRRTARVIAKAGRTADVEFRLKTPAGTAPFCVEAEANLKWFGVPVKMRRMKIGRGGIHGMWFIGPFDNEGKLQDKEYCIEKPPIDMAKVHAGQSGTLIAWQWLERETGFPVEVANNVYLCQHFGEARNSYAYALVRVKAARAMKAVLSVGASDALAVWVNGNKVHQKLTGRDWSPDEDRIALELRKGSNEILLKSIHGGGLWFLSPQLLDLDGYPLEGVVMLK